LVPNRYLFLRDSEAVLRGGDAAVNASLQQDLADLFLGQPVVYNSCGSQSRGYNVLWNALKRITHGC